MPSDRISNLFDHKPEEEHADVASNQPPPAPPPIQPTSQNPYDFITNPGQPTKKGFLLSGNLPKNRIVVAVVGAFILLTIAILAISFISSIGGASKDDYKSLVQQQTELIRIADIGITKSTQSEAKNLATTTKLTLVSQQPAIFGFAKKAGVSTEAKALSIGKNTQTDTLLTTAEQNNKFDEVFTKTLQTNLKQYQQTIKKIYEATSTKKTKDILLKNYQDIGKLLQSSDATPATKS